jgi:hypothetical protein
MFRPFANLADFARGFVASEGDAKRGLAPYRGDFGGHGWPKRGDWMTGFLGIQRQQTGFPEVAPSVVQDYGKTHLFNSSLSVIFSLPLSASA